MIKGGIIFAATWYRDLSKRVDETDTDCMVGFVIVFLKSKDWFMEGSFRVNSTTTSLI